MMSLVYTALHIQLENVLPFVVCTSQADTIQSLKDDVALFNTGTACKRAMDGQLEDHQRYKSLRMNDNVVDSFGTSLTIPQVDTTTTEYYTNAIALPTDMVQSGQFHRTELFDENQDSPFLLIDEEEQHRVFTSNDNHVFYDIQNPVLEVQNKITYENSEITCNIPSHITKCFSFYSKKKILSLSSSPNLQKWNENIISYYASSIIESKKSNTYDLEWLYSMLLKNTTFGMEKSRIITCLKKLGNVNMAIFSNAYVQRVKDIALDFRLNNILSKKNAHIVSEYDELIDKTRKVDDPALVYTTYRQAIVEIFYLSKEIVLKPQLWKLMFYMPELLFYLEWSSKQEHFENIAICNMIEELEQIIEVIKKYNMLCINTGDKKSMLILEKAIRKLRQTILLSLTTAISKSLNYCLYAMAMHYKYDDNRYSESGETYNQILFILSFTVESEPVKQALSGFIESLNMDITLILQCDIFEQIFNRRNCNSDIILTLVFIIDYLEHVKGVEVDEDKRIFMIIPYENMFAVVAQNPNGKEKSLFFMKHESLVNALCNTIEVLLACDAK